MVFPVSGFGFGRTPQRFAFGVAAVEGRKQSFQGNDQNLNPIFFSLGVHFLNIQRNHLKTLQSCVATSLGRVEEERERIIY